MWNDQSVAGGGGFYNSPNQFGTATTPNQAQKTGRRTSRTAPLVITQALNCGDEGVKIWGTDIQIVSVVARIRNIRLQSTKITYTIQDITGRMRAVLWIDQESMDEDDKSAPKVQVNDYIQIYGNIKTNKGRKLLMAFKIIPVSNVNLITFHYLQCINNKVKMEAESKKEKVPTAQPSFVHGLPANSMVGMSDNNGSVNGLNPRQMMVFNLIRSSTLEQGISKQDMYASLKDRMAQVEFDGLLITEYYVSGTKSMSFVDRDIMGMAVKGLRNILEWMCGEGHIYSTIDEEHFRATDA